MSFGFLLGIIVSPIIMGLIFFGIFTPIAILMRLFGRDELRLRFKKQSSHWVIKDNDLQSETFKQQF